MSKTPPHLRQLRATMALKGLTLRVVAKRARIPYTYASELLSGARQNPVRLSKLETVIAQAQEVHPA